MKITPINFASVIEPELLSFWKSRKEANASTPSIQRIHNFGLVETSLAFYASESSTQEPPIFSILLVEIPQQETNAAIKCLIYIPSNLPIELLMIFKNQNDDAMWTRKIIKKIEKALDTKLSNEQKTEPEEPLPEE